MAGGVGWPRGTASTVPRRFVWLGWRLCARRARRGRTVLRCPRRRSRRTVSRSPSDSLDSLVGQSTRLSCGGDGRARLSCGACRTVLIVPLDTHRTVLRCPRRTVLQQWWQGWTAAAVIARLDSGGGDRRRHVYEMDTAYMG
jgi:hypothetical protein